MIDGASTLNSIIVHASLAVATMRDILRGLGRGLVKLCDQLHGTDDATPVVLTIGFHDSLSRTSWRDVRVVTARMIDDVLETFTRELVALFVMGPLLSPKEAHRLLTRRLLEFPESRALNIVCGAGTDAAMFQEYIDNDSIFYLARGSLSDDDLHSLARSAIDRARPVVGDTREVSTGTGLAPDSLREFYARVSMQDNLPAVADLVVETAQGLLSADTVRCFMFDWRTDALWSRDPVSREVTIESASAGLVAYVARTGERVVLANVTDDARYDQEVDNPRGLPDACFVAEPVFRSRGAVAGVVAAVRRGTAGPFSTDERRLLEQLVVYVTPVINLLVLEEELCQSTADHLGAGTDIYRKEAVEHHARGLSLEGHLLTAAPPWLKWGHWIALGTFVALGLAALMLMKVHEYASGSAVVRPRVQTVLTAATAAMVRSVDVSVGQRIAAGALMVHTVRPGANGEEPLWAPAAGVVASLTARPGVWLAPGDPVATIVDDAAGFEVIAFLPASYEPQLSPGMPLMLRLNGYADSSELLSIEQVGPVILNRAEAIPYMGDSVPFTGPLIVLRARVPKATFGSAGRRYPYRSGLTGGADVAIDARSALTTLIPALKAVTAW